MADERNESHDGQTGQMPEQGFAEQTKEPILATDRLKVAREKFLGKDVLIHDGQLEKGIGSKFHALHPAHKAHLAAIEHLIAVEAEHAQAEGALAAVHVKVEHALERVKATEKASDEASEKEAQ